MKNLSKYEIKIIAGGNFYCICQNEKGEQTGCVAYSDFNSCRDFCCEKENSKSYKIQHHYGYVTTSGICLNYTLDALRNTKLNQQFIIEVEKNIRESYYL